MSAKRVRNQNIVLNYDADNGQIKKFSSYNAPLDIKDIDASYHIRAVNQHLILSSSAGSIVTSSGSINIEGGGSIISKEQHLILSSSAGSAITISSSLYLEGSGSIVSKDQHFILSSSYGSTVTISSSLNIDSSGSITSRDQHLILSCSYGSTITNSGSIDIVGSGSLTSRDQHLILSSSYGSAITISSSLNIDSSGSITSTDQHLTLSCSYGSLIMTSGNLHVSGNLGVGTPTIPHGGIGTAKFAIEGANASDTAGPHLQVTTAADNYPLWQLYNYTHDNITISFDAYRHSDGSWRSSDAGSNFAIRKTSDQLRFQYDSGVTAGDIVTWNNGIILDTTGGVHMLNMKSGTDQTDAGAAAGELYFDTNDDDTVKMGT